MQQLAPCGVKPCDGFRLQQLAPCGSMPNGVVCSRCENGRGEFDCDSAVANSKGWWIAVDGLDPFPLDLNMLQGRTLRQEREGLGIMDVDTTRTSVSVVSKGGVMNASWGFKFPFSAFDAAAVVLHTSDLRPESRQPIAATVPKLRYIYTKVEEVCGSNCTPWSCEVKAEHEPVARCPNRSSTPQHAGCKDQIRAKVHVKSMQPGEPRATTVFFSFISGWKCISRSAQATVAQVLEDEWGVSPTSCITRVNGRQVSPSTSLMAVPPRCACKDNCEIEGRRSTGP